MLDLSPEQKAAVQYVKGPLLVLAGAGSGKTSVLIHKLAWLLREYDVEPAAILTLTVNPYAASAIRAGVWEILGRKVANLSISTFSEFALRLVQQRPRALGLRAGFSLYDPSESEAVVARLLRENLPHALPMAGEVWRCIADHKRRTDSPPPPVPDPPPPAPAEIAKWLHGPYEQRLRIANAIDVIELPRQAARALGSDTALLGEWQRRVRFLLVDEYEQTGSGEHGIVRLLAAAGVRLTAAGDDLRPEDGYDEAGGDFLARLQAELPDIRVLRLPQNFRSTGRILKAVHRLVDPPPPESAARLGRPRTLGAPLRALQVRSEQHEPESIVQALLDHKFRHDAGYHDYAILYRRAEQAPALARALRAYRVPYHLRGGPTFFEQTEVRDFWAYLKLLCNPADDNAFLRVISTPRRDIDHETLARLMRFAAEHERCLFDAALDPQLARALAPAQFAALQSVMEVLRVMIERAEHAEAVQLARDLLAELRYEEWLRDTCNDLNIATRRMENVMRLVDMLGRLAQKRPGAGLRALVTELNLNSVLDPQEQEPSGDGVALVSLARVQGMEFAHVYLAALEETPWALAPAADEPDRAREQRLLYIAFTRARESVTFTVPERHLPAGAAPRPVPFLNGMSPHDLDWINANPSSLFAEPTLARGTGQADPVQRYSK